MKCFRKPRESRESLYLEKKTSTEVSGYPRQHTFNQSSDVNPTSSAKLDEPQLSKIVGESSREITDSTQSHLLQSTDKARICQISGEAEGVPPSLITAIDSPQCPHHRDRALNLYCPSHDWPVCALCASTTHLSCSEIQNLDEACQEKSEELGRFVHALRDHGESVAELIRKVERKLELKEGDQKAGATGSPNHSDAEPLAAQCEGCPQRIMVYLPLEATVNTSSTEAPAISQEIRVDNSSSMWIKLTAPPGFSLDELQIAPQIHRNRSPHRELKVYALTDQSGGPMQTCSGMSSPGMRHRFQPCDDRPHGPDLAKVLQVGHRVRRNVDVEGRNLGTIVAIPSISITHQSGDVTGLVDVRWDVGGEGTYRMGRYNHFDLDLA